MERSTRKGLQHDGLVDAVSSSAAHFQKHSRTYIAAFAAILIFALVAAVVLYRRSVSRDEAARILNAARSSAALEEIVQKYPGTPSASLALMALGDFLFRQGQYEAAQGRYRLFLETYPEHELAGFAQMGIGYCRESQEKLEEAINAYRLVEQKFSGFSLGAEALFNVARCQAALGRVPDALITYDLIISQYPQSSFVSAAREQTARLSGGGGKESPVVPAAEGVPASTPAVPSGG